MTTELEGLAQYLWELSDRLSRQAREGRVAYAVPPPDLERRLNGGPNPSIARYYADVLTRPPLPADARILDMGCGYGRIALELTSRMTPDQQYFGLDPHAEAVDWATANIAARHPNVSFSYVDLASKAYNARGRLKGRKFVFPFADASLDLIFMISVNTHIDAKTVQNYIAEAARTLKPTGRLVATYFLLDDEVKTLLADGRSKFRMRWRHGPSRVENRTNPELAIAHPRALVQKMLADAGFSEPVIMNGSWSGRTGTAPMDYQDLVIAARGVDSEAPDLEVSVPNDREQAAVEAAARQLVDAGITDASRAADVLDWAFSVVVNAYWWHDRGLTLATASAAPTGGFEPLGLGFAACRSLRFETQTPPDAASGEFTPIDDHGMLNLLVDAGPVTSQGALLTSIVEVVENGMLLRRAMQGGAPLVLVAPDGRVIAAPVPREQQA